MAEEPNERESDQAGRGTGPQDPNPGSPAGGGQIVQPERRALGKKLAQAKDKVLDPTIGKFNEELKKKSLQLGG